MSAPAPPSGEGLSAEQLEQLLAGDWLTVGPLRLNQDLSEEDLRPAVILENARRFLRAALEPSGLPATAEGRLNRGALELLLDRMHWGAYDHPEPAGQELPADARENDVRPLGITRVLLERLHLIERRAGAFHATAAAVPLLEPEMAGRFFAMLFRGFFRDLTTHSPTRKTPRPTCTGTRRTRCGSSRRPATPGGGRGSWWRGSCLPEWRRPRPRGSSAFRTSSHRRRSY